MGRVRRCNYLSGQPAEPRGPESRTETCLESSFRAPFESDSTPGVCAAGDFISRPPGLVRFSPGSFGPDYVSETLDGTCESLSSCFWCEAKDFKIADLASRKKKKELTLLHL